MAFTNSFWASFDPDIVPYGNISGLSSLKSFRYNLSFFLKDRLKPFLTISPQVSKYYLVDCPKKKKRRFPENWVIQDTVFDHFWQENSIFHHFSRKNRDEIIFFSQKSSCLKSLISPKYKMSISRPLM